MSSGRRHDPAPRSLSPEEIALLSRVTRAVPDLLGACRLVYPADRMAGAVPEAVRGIEETFGAELEYAGNWWVTGNPYKGVNCVFLSTRGPGAGWERFEVQFHSPESAELARENHSLYEVERDPGRPLAERQRAHDEMVERFAGVPHPPGIEGFGERVVKGRPVSAVERERARRDEDEAALGNLLAELAASTGATVVPDRSELPGGLQERLDEALELTEARDYPGALRVLDAAIERYRPRMAEDGVVRGVTLAMVRSSGVLTHLGRYDDALGRCDEVLAICDDDYFGSVSGMFAREYQAREAKEWVQRMRADAPLVESTLHALGELASARHARHARQPEPEPAPPRWWRRWLRSGRRTSR